MRPAAVCGKPPGGCLHAHKFFLKWDRHTRRRVREQLEEQLDEAIQVARTALAQARKEPTAKSKRGHDVAHPMWRCYFEASEVAVRRARELRHSGGPGELDFDDELSKLGL